MMVCQDDELRMSEGYESEAIDDHENIWQRPERYFTIVPWLQSL
jgi:hypothetical protein